MQTDGEIGKVQGLVVYPRDQHITHLLLETGHFWSPKHLAIPIQAVLKVDADHGIQLNLSKHEVGELPPVEPTPLA
jgi:sporulation protein YlmC with PRC-barrel domain